MTTDQENTAEGTLDETQRRLKALLEAEVALLRQAFAKGMRRLVMAAVLLIIAILLVLVALNVLAGTAVATLVASGFAPIWAGLMLALGLVLTATVLLKFGASALSRAVHGVAQPVQSLGRDVQAMKAAYDEE